MKLQTRHQSKVLITETLVMLHFRQDSQTLLKAAHEHRPDPASAIHHPAVESCHRGLGCFQVSEFSNYISMYVPVNISDTKMKVQNARAVLSGVEWSSLLLFPFMTCQHKLPAPGGTLSLPGVFPVQETAPQSP